MRFLGIRNSFSLRHCRNQFPSSLTQITKINHVSISTFPVNVFKTARIRFSIPHPVESLVNIGGHFLIGARIHKFGKVFYRDNFIFPSLWIGLNLGAGSFLTAKANQ